MFKRMLDRFRKAPPPAPGPDRLPDYLKDSPVDWQGGDVAIVRERGPWFSEAEQATKPGPDKGAMCKVIFVDLVDGLQFLRLMGWDGVTYHADCFDKLRPSSTSVEAMIARHRSKPKTPERIDA